MNFDQLKDLIAAVGFPAVMAILLLVLLQRELRQIHADLHQLRETIQRWFWENEKHNRKD